MARIVALAVALVAGSQILVSPGHALDGAGRYVPGQLIVKFRPGATASARRASVAALGAGEMRALGATGAQRLTLAGLDVPQALAQLRSDPAVEYAEPNYLYHFADVPNDSLFAQQWALGNSGQTGGTPGVDVNVVRAWDVSVGSPSVLVAIIDSGVDISHPDLAANIYTNPGEIAGNGLDDDGNQLVDDVHGWDFAQGNNDPVDWMSHGTHIAGIVGAAGNNRTGTSGVAWRVRLLPIKVADPGGNLPLDAAIQAIGYAVRMHARIINASWGGPDSSEALRQAIIAANAAGVLFVAAAGNEAKNNDLIPYYPANYEIPNVISVANTDSKDKLALLSSNWGPATVDLAAPGEAILSTIPGARYGMRSGTSMAAPLVTGALALILAVNPPITAAQAKALLLSSVHPDPYLAGLVSTGGRLDVFAPIASRLVSLTDTGAALSGLACSATAWADIDGDGDLDFAVAGTAGATPFTRIYRNDGPSGFTDIGAALTGVSCATVTWGDFDRDGDPDLLVTGLSSTGPVAKLYRNDAGTFTAVATSLPGVQSGAAAWGDFDNDGDLDLALAGVTTGGVSIARVYRNDGGGAFTDIGAGLPGVAAGALAWVDTDGDGDLDLLLAGDTGAGSVTRLYRNDAGVFTDAQAGLPGVHDAALAAADFDNDGDPDLLIAGDTGGGLVTRVYRNDAGAFTDIGAALPGLKGGTVAWADYDNDGDPDILLSGTRDSSGVGVPYTHVFANDGGGAFRPIGLALANVRGATAWADVDNDGDLDLLQAGDGESGPLVRVYRSSGAPANTPPGSPYGLTSALSGNQLTLSWGPSFDARTPPSAVTYNLRVGTGPKRNDIVSGMANATTGYRWVVQPGNAGTRRSWKLTLPPGPVSYYWSVSALDGAFAASRFAADQAFTRTLGVGDGAPAELSFALEGENPLRGAATFRFGLPARAHVALSVHDVAGRQVARLADGTFEPGVHTLSWAPATGRERLAPGVYFARLAVDGREITRTVVALR